MTFKAKKTKRITARAQPRKAQPRKIDRLRASAEDESVLGAEVGGADEIARWNRPRKQRISLRVDVEVVEWFKSTGSGYQTRINRILRSVMAKGKKTKSQK